MRYRTVLVITVLALMCCEAIGHTNYLPRMANVPGGIAQLVIDSETKPTGFFLNKQIMIISNNGNDAPPWSAIIGIPLSLQSGVYPIQIKHPLHFTQLFYVRQEPYQFTCLEILENKKNYPHPQDNLRFANEHAEIEQILSYWSEPNPFKSVFKAPLQGRISRDFGLGCQLNHDGLAAHLGVDIAAPVGAPIKAAAPGIVLQTGDYFTMGQTVFLDHGQGLISIYAHLNEILVKPDQYVAQDKILGTVGQSGNALHAHLHWEVVLNQVRVNPFLFILKSDILAQATDNPKSGS